MAITAKKLGGFFNREYLKASNHLDSLVLGNYGDFYRKGEMRIWIPLGYLDGRLMREWTNKGWDITCTGNKREDKDGKKRHYSEEVIFREMPELTEHGYIKDYLIWSSNLEREILETIREGTKQKGDFVIDQDGTESNRLGFIIYIVPKKKLKYVKDTEQFLLGLNLPSPNNSWPATRNDIYYKPNIVETFKGKQRNLPIKQDLSGKLLDINAPEPELRYPLGFYPCVNGLKIVAQHNLEYITYLRTIWKKLNK